ncbi:MAG: hypothetical protein ACI841_004908 [Planctomycetota bacterium]|jgi:uncharacterized protein (TIGR02270 family)
MNDLGRPSVLLDIVEEHFDELDFLWELREGNVFTRDWDLSDLAGHEERAEAHLDGLRLAELHAVELATERIASASSFEAGAAAIVLTQFGVAEHEDLILKTLTECEEEPADGIRYALRHFANERLFHALSDVATSRNAIAAAVASDVLAFHRIPVLGAEHIAQGETPWLRRIGLECLGRLGQLGEQHLGTALEDAEASVRLTALREAARARVPHLAVHTRTAATRSTDPDADALTFLGVLGDPADIRVIEDSLARPELGDAALFAFGAMGRVETIPRIIELMGDDTLGLSATVAYQRITGAADVEAEKPFPPPPVAEGEDEQEELPPDPEKAAADWKRRQSVMTAEFAWQAGQPLEQDQLPAAFHHLRLDSRRDVYLRLRARQTAQVADLELEQLALRQLKG